MSVIDAVIISMRCPDIDFLFSNKLQPETMSSHQEIVSETTTIATRSNDCFTSLFDAQKLEEIEIRDESGVK